MCGKAVIHDLRLVLSDRRVDFFKTSLNRKICLLCNRRGCKSIKPAWPYTSEPFLGINVFLRRLCIFLNLNFRGRNTNYTSLSGC